MMAPVRTLCKLRNTSFLFRPSSSAIGHKNWQSPPYPTLLYETIAILFQISYRPMAKAKATAWALVLALSLALVRRYGMIWGLLKIAVGFCSWRRSKGEDK